MEARKISIAIVLCFDSSFLSAYLEIFSVEIEGMYVAHALVFDLRNEFERRYFLEKFQLYELDEEFPMQDARKYLIESLTSLARENSCLK